jgi:hypothetical protein
MREWVVKSFFLAEISNSICIRSILGNYSSVHYRKYVNYQLDWNVDIAKNLVAIAPYGGLIGKKLN